MPEPSPIGGAADTPDQKQRETTPEVSIFSERNLDLPSLLIGIPVWQSQLPEHSSNHDVFLYEHSFPETSRRRLLQTISLCTECCEASGLKVSAKEANTKE